MSDTPPVTAPDEAHLPHPISDALEKALKDTIAERPSTAHGIASVTASSKGVELKVTHQIREGWELGVWGGMEWHGTPQAGVRLEGHW